MADSTGPLVCGNCQHPPGDHDWTFKTCNQDAPTGRQAKRCDSECTQYVPSRWDQA